MADAYGSAWRIVRARLERHALLLSSCLLLECDWIGKLFLVLVGFVSLDLLLKLVGCLLPSAWLSCIRLLLMVVRPQRAPYVGSTPARCPLCQQRFVSFSRSRGNQNPCL
jgi:hypothetical protein